MLEEKNEKLNQIKEWDFYHTLCNITASIHFALKKKNQLSVTTEMIHMDLDRFKSIYGYMNKEDVQVSYRKLNPKCHMERRGNGNFSLTSENITIDVNVSGKCFIY